MSRILFATFVRHGETTLNVQRLLQGQTDVPLSETGIKQAKLLGVFVSGQKFTRAYASDLCRAKLTAELILQQSQYPVEIVVDRRLRERGYGEAEGKHVQYLFDEAAKLGVKVSEYTPPGAETPAALTERALRFFNELCNVAEVSESPENVIVVSHGGWIQFLMRELNLNSSLYSLENFVESQALRVHHNTGVTRLSIRPSTNDGTKKWLIAFSQINDTNHLKL